jgi:hypothetical protein
MMNATTQAAQPHTGSPSTPPSRAAEPSGYSWPRSMPQRLSVWDERARKMGFPPSAR